MNLAKLKDILSKEYVIKEMCLHEYALVTEEALNVITKSQFTMCKVNSWLFTLKKNCEN